MFQIFFSSTSRLQFTVKVTSVIYSSEPMVTVNFYIRDDNGDKILKIRADCFSNGIIKGKCYSFVVTQIFLYFQLTPVYEEIARKLGRVFIRFLNFAFR